MDNINKPKFKKDFEIRKTYIKSYGFSQNDMKMKTVGYGDIIDSNNNTKSTISAVSGIDKGQQISVISYNNEFSYNAPIPNSNTIFTTRKTSSAGINLTDSEIKIFDLAHNKFHLGSNLFVFSDRVTCEYCQDVSRRIKKAEMSIGKPDSKKYLDLSDAIFANFKLISLYGGPLYIGENFTQDKIDEVQKLFDNKISCP